MLSPKDKVNEVESRLKHKRSELLNKAKAAHQGLSDSDYEEDDDLTTIDSEGNELDNEGIEDETLDELFPYLSSEEQELIEWIDSILSVLDD